MRAHVVVVCSLVLLTWIGGAATRGFATTWPNESHTPVADFNRQIRLAFLKGETWTRSPILVSLRLIGETCECSSRQIELTSTPEAFQDGTITITDQGLLDDSIRGYRYHLALARVARGYWQIKEATKTLNCQKGRGHQEFSNQPCS
jgi:hypothetical protein